MVYLRLYLTVGVLCHGLSKAVSDIRSVCHGLSEAVSDSRTLSWSN